jgi:SAM-dependent methyltransferase
VGILNSFHHYLHPIEALTEIHRVLRPGGRLCILDVNADNHLVRWMDGRTRQKEAEHVRFYSSVEYAKMFEKAGLKAVVSRMILPPVKVHIAER